MSPPDSSATGAERPIIDITQNYGAAANSKSGLPTPENGGSSVRIAVECFPVKVAEGSPGGSRTSRSTFLDTLSAGHGGGFAFEHRACKNRACMKNDSESVKPLRLCSRCNSVYYCSNKCAAAYWKEHKSFCIEYAKEANRIEAKTLCSPLESEMRRAFAIFVDHSFANELEYASFMAYRLAHPGGKLVEETSYLSLVFEYDSSQPTNRRQFTLARGGLLPIQGYLDMCEKQGMPLGLLDQATLKKNCRIPPPDLVGADPNYIITPVLLIATDALDRCRPTMFSRPRPYFQSPVGECLEWLDVLMEKDWLEVVQRSLKGPAPRSFGEIYDRTIRERLPQHDVPFDVNVTFDAQSKLSREEKERTTRQIRELYLRRDFKKEMMDHRKLGTGGGIVTSNPDGDASTITSQSVGKLIDLKVTAKKQEELKAAKKAAARSGVGASGSAK